MRLGWLLVVAAAWLGNAPGAHAYKIYAEKEKKNCAYCHTRPEGGGPRNYRGVYYKTHGLSFAGFVDPTPPAGTAVAAPSFQQVWQQVLGMNPTRIGTADLVGDKKPRLILVNTGKNPGARSISIQGWDPQAQKLTEEANIPVNTDADRMEIGRFATDRTAVIALPDGYVRSDGKTYSLHRGGSDMLYGAARLKDGSEAFYTVEDNVATPHMVNMGADDAKWMAPAPRMPLPLTPAFTWLEARGPAASAMALKLGAPGDLTGLSLLGIWDPALTGLRYFYLPQHVALGDKAGDYVVFYAVPDGKKASRNSTTGEGDASAPQPVWTSPKLLGKVLDITPGPNIRTGEGQGLYVLVDGSTEDEGRTLYFFDLK